MSSEKMRAHTPDYKKQNDLAELALAKAGRERIRELLKQARELAALIAPLDEKGMVPLRDHQIRSAIERLADAIERVMST